jgi:hypothetical protein
MIESDSPTPAGQTPRLVISWLIIGIPLAYGVFQTIKTVQPLFGG